MPLQQTKLSNENRFRCICMVCVQWDLNFTSKKERHSYCNPHRFRPQTKAYCIGSSGWMISEERKLSNPVLQSRIIWIILSQHGCYRLSWKFPQGPELGLVLELWRRSFQTYQVEWIHCHQLFLVHVSNTPVSLQTFSLRTFRMAVLAREYHSIHSNAWLWNSVIGK